MKHGDKDLYIAWLERCEATFQRDIHQIDKNPIEHVCRPIEGSITKIKGWEYGFANGAPVHCRRYPRHVLSQVQQLLACFKNHVDSPLDSDGKVKKQLIDGLQVKKNLTGLPLSFAYDIKKKRVKHFRRWTYIYDANGEGTWELDTGLYENAVQIFDESATVDGSNWTDMVSCAATKALLQAIMPLVGDWDLSQQKHRQRVQLQVLGYQRNAKLGAHHDLVGGFDKSMILVALHDGFMHFDMKLMSNNSTGLFTVPFNAGDVLIVDKDSFADIVFKHGILGSDVEAFRMSIVLRQVCIGADNLVHRPIKSQVLSDSECSCSESSDSQSTDSESSGSESSDSESSMSQTYDSSCSNVMCVDSN